MDLQAPPDDPKVSGHQVSLPAASCGDKRDVGGRPTAVALAAKDRTQLRLSFGPSGISGRKLVADAPAGTRTGHPTRGSGLAPPPKPQAQPKGPSKPKGNARAQNVPERSGSAPKPAASSDMAVAIKAVKEGRGESLTKKDLLALLVGLLESGTHSSTPAPALEEETQPSGADGRPSKRVRGDGGAAVAAPPPPARLTPSDPMPVDTGTGTPPATADGWTAEEMAEADGFMALGAQIEASVEDPDPSWTPAPAKASRSKGKGKAKADPPQVSVPTPTQTPDPTKRVALRVSPPKAKAGEGDKTTPDTKVVFDGVPTGTTFLGFSRTLDRFYRTCAERDGSDFPESPVTASTHRLGQGGWVVSYRDADTATKVLAQDPAIFAAVAGIDPAIVDIHRPGSPTRRGERVTATTDRSVFIHIEPALLGEIWDEVRAAVAKVDGDTQWAPYAADAKGRSPKPGVPTIPAHRVLLEAALMESFRPPEDTTFEKVQVLGSTGAIIALMSSVEGATRAIAEGIQVPALGRSLVARKALRPDQRGGLAFCSRCLGVGHRPNQCDQKPRCRTCGASGHCESLGVCPKHKKHEGQPGGKEPFCVLCGTSGHKAGAPTCAEMRRTVKTLAKGPDGTYAASVVAARTARVAAAKVTLTAVAAGARGNAWSNPLPGTGGTVGRGGPGQSVPAQESPQAALKMDRLERALLEMQTQMCMMMKVIMAGHSHTAPGADSASQAQEDDRMIASSLAMHN